MSRNTKLSAPNALALSVSSALLVVWAAFSAWLFLPGPLRAAGPDAPFTLADPRGDDHGDGSLKYPIRSDLARGDLDLLSFTARPEKNGTRFVATFARPIAKPTRRAIDAGGTALDAVARHGFYTFNLDVYVDTDRVPGSGNVATLPGRKAEIDPASAWERAICLTPRPAEARETLRRLLARREKKELAAERRKRLDSVEKGQVEERVKSLVAETVFFPTEVRVNGPNVEFFVPASFLGGAARPTWSYVVAVSFADLEQRLDVPATLGLAEAAPDSLMVLPIAPGTHADRAGGGRDDDPLQPPLVDVAVPKGKKQEDVLKDSDPASARPVRLPGVVPADER